MSVAICILAKDEERTIGHALEQVARQTLLGVVTGTEVHVVANGTTDSTVRKAEAKRRTLDAAGALLIVHDLKQPGKSRAWNRTVHDLLGHHVKTALFMDADIELHTDRVLEDLTCTLADDPTVKICSSYPVKEISRKSAKSPLDIFSLAVSSKSRKPGVVNGQLYAARMANLRHIWLPDETPGEDGFLNAMVTTNGFTSEPDPSSVRTPDVPTHSYKAHKPLGFFSHERRMIVGTVINMWIFEHLWNLRSQMPVGALIRKWNDEDPQWVDRIIRERIGTRRWLVPNEILFGRLSQRRTDVLRWLAYLPAGLAATILTLPAAVMANQRLKETGAASTW